MSVVGTADLLSGWMVGGDSGLQPQTANARLINPHGRLTVDSRETGFIGELGKPYGYEGLVRD